MQQSFRLAAGNTSRNLGDRKRHYDEGNKTDEQIFEPCHTFHGGIIAHSSRTEELGPHPCRHRPGLGSSAEITRSRAYQGSPQILTLLVLSVRRVKKMGRYRDKIA